MFFFKSDILLDFWICGVKRFDIIPKPCMEKGSVHIILYHIMFIPLVVISFGTSRSYLHSITDEKTRLLSHLPSNAQSRRQSALSLPLICSLEWTHFRREWEAVSTAQAPLTQLSLRSAFLCFASKLIFILHSYFYSLPIKMYRSLA